MVPGVLKIKNGVVVIQLTPVQFLLLLKAIDVVKKITFLLLKRTTLVNGILKMDTGAVFLTIVRFTQKYIYIYIY